MQEKYYTIKQLYGIRLQKLNINHILPKKVKNKESVIIYQTGANKLFEHFISSDKTVTSINDTNNSSSKHDKVTGNKNGNKTNNDTENISSNENEVSYKEPAREIIKAKDEMISI